MADATSSSGGGGNTALAFIVGILLVAVIVLGFFMFTGGHIGNSGTNVNIPSHMSVDVKPHGS
jgi:hypothetical protein